MSASCECCESSGRGLCDELITRPEESYRQPCVVVCGQETSWMRRPWPVLGSSTKIKNMLLVTSRFKKWLLSTLCRPLQISLSFERHIRLCYLTTRTLLGDLRISSLRAKSPHCPKRLHLSAVPCSNIFLYILFQKLALYPARKLGFNS
jgi:hypothetical protein